MRDYKHAYCSGESYSASSSVGHLACYYPRTRVREAFCACAPPRFSAFIYNIGRAFLLRTQDKDRFASKFFKN